MANPSSCQSPAIACLIEVISADGQKGCLLDLVIHRRRVVPPSDLLLHDVPLSMRRGACLLPALCPVGQGPMAAAAQHQWEQLPSLPPARAVPRLPRQRAAAPPPRVNAAMAIPEQPPPAATDLPATRFPYLGDFAGASWNTQALFARKRGRHDVKHHYVHRLMRGRDFVTLSDTHGLEGGTEVWARPLGCSAWFSPGTSRRGGVGIVVRDSFLRQFRAMATHRSKSSGRVAAAR